MTNSALFSEARFVEEQTVAAYETLAKSLGIWCISSGLTVSAVSGLKMAEITAVKWCPTKNTSLNPINLLLSLLFPPTHRTESGNMLSQDPGTTRSGALGRARQPRSRQTPLRPTDPVPSSPQPADLSP